MTAARLAKKLGAKNLTTVADFYECTTAHLRNVFHRNQNAFKAMIVGYVTTTQDRE